MATLLEVRNLRTSFRTAAGIVRAVDGVSFAVAAGEILGLVGGSGGGNGMSCPRPCAPFGEVARGSKRLS